MSRRTVCIVVATLVVLASVGVPVGVDWAAGASWRAMEQWAEQGVRDWDARDFTRAPIGGAVVPGSAFACYREALAKAGQLTQGDETKLLARLQLQVEPGDAATVDAVIARWQPVLALVQEGSRRKDARPDVDWSKGFAGAVNLLQVRNIANAATIVLHRRLLDGDTTGALDAQLAVMGFTADLFQLPTMVEQLIAGAAVHITVAEAWRDEDLQKLDEAAMKRLAAGLLVVEERVAACRSKHGEVLMLAETMLRAGSVGKALKTDDGALRSWRYGWSEKWAVASAVNVLVELLAEPAERKWEDRFAQLERQAGRLAANPLGKLLAWVSADEMGLRMAQADVRMLRTAVALHLGQYPPPLQDPFAPCQLELASKGKVVTISCTTPQGQTPRRRMVTLR